MVPCCVLPLLPKTQANHLAQLRWTGKTLQCIWSSWQWTPLSHLFSFLCNWTIIPIPNCFGKYDFSVQILTFHLICRKKFLCKLTPPLWGEVDKYGFSLHICTFHLIPRKKISFQFDPHPSLSSWEWGLANMNVLFRSPYFMQFWEGASWSPLGKGLCKVPNHWAFQSPLLRGFRKPLSKRLC